MAPERAHTAKGLYIDGVPPMQPGIEATIYAADRKAAAQARSWTALTLRDRAADRK